MQTGELDQRITFESLVETNQQGSVVEQWSNDSPPDTVWGKVISERGGEAFEAARVNARATIRVCVRFRDDIDETWRLKWRDVVYQVKTVDPSERRAGYLWMTAERAKG